MLLLTGLVLSALRQRTARLLVRGAEVLQVGCGGWGGVGTQLQQSNLLISSVCLAESRCKQGMRSFSYLCSWLL